MDLVFKAHCNSYLFWLVVLFFFQTNQSNVTIVILNYIKHVHIHIKIYQLKLTMISYFLSVEAEECEENYLPEQKLFVHVSSSTILLLHTHILHEMYIYNMSCTSHTDNNNIKHYFHMSRILVKRSQMAYKGP